MTLLRLGPRFFLRDAESVARQLIGCYLIRVLNRKKTISRIIETEAYVGAHDLASHASKGRTPRTEVMFGPAGHVYVYFIYGMYDMLNIVTSKVNDAQAVLIRALEPVNHNLGPLNGPGRLTRTLQIGRHLNAINLSKDKELYVAKGTPPKHLTVTTRVGVDYAGPWRNAKLRFYETENPFVSRP